MIINMSDISNETCPSTVKNLKNIAKSLNIKNYSKMNKNELENILPKIKLIGTGVQGDIFLVGQGKKKFVLKKIYNVSKTDVSIFLERIEKIKKYGCSKNTLCIIKPEYIKYDEKNRNFQYATKYINGLTLDKFDDLVYDKKIKVRRKTFENIILQILNGVKYLNDNNICHNDLNAKNIMINPKNFNVKIIDYDYSTILSNVKIIGFDGNTINRKNKCYDMSTILSLVSEYGHFWKIPSNKQSEITKPFRTDEI